MNPVYCLKCKHYQEGVLFESMWVEERCKANPRDTYLGPNRAFADPAVKNAENNCPDYEPISGS